MGPTALALTLNDKNGTTDVELPETCRSSASPGSTATEITEDETSEPGPSTTACAEATLWLPRHR